MFDPKLYREACRELTAPEDKLEEIVAMTENTNKKARRPLRTALICAAAIALMVVSVAAADPEGVQEFFYKIASIVRVDQYRMELITEDGEQVTVFSCPQAGVEERDGRAILVIDGEDAADITDALKAEGRYTYESVAEGSRLLVTVEGTATDWIALVTIGDPDGPVYTFSSDSEGNGSAGAPAVPEEVYEGAVVSTYTYENKDGVFISEGQIS